MQAFGTSDMVRGDDEHRAAHVRRSALIAAVSAATFAIYALAVSAAGAPPSVHAAGLVLWVAHVILLFGRTPGPKPGSDDRRLDELGADALGRATDAAASLSVDAPRRRD